ncbi:MAG: rhodanese-like domain-containing protein [Nitrospirota bacterium]
MRAKLIVLAVAVFSVFSFAAAQEFKDLRAEEVKKLIDAKAKMLLVDARTRQEYVEGHIPTAANIPPENIYGIDRLLPKDKTTLLVFYCRGIG